jgi:hypothetical protein
VTPLFCAAYYGKPECVQLLLERGADKEAKSVVRAPHTRATVAARCVGARRVCRSVGHGRTTLENKPRRCCLRRARRVAAARSGLLSENDSRPRRVAAVLAGGVSVLWGGGAPPLRPTAATRALLRRRGPRLLMRLCVSLWALCL